jgi:hypothetical protein
LRPVRHVALLAPLALLLAAAPACVSRGRTNDTPAGEGRPQRTVLRVENLGFSDMTIYVVRSGSERIRLGMAGGNRTTVLEIPTYLVQFPTPLRFIADPIGSSRTPVSDEITVNPGEEVVLTIPPS